MSQEKIDEILQKDERPSFIDLFSGIFTEPGKTFEKIKQTSPHFTDWFFPIVLFVIIAALANFISMSDPVISMKIQEKQMERVEKSLAELVEQGNMTEEQMNEQLETIRENIEKQMQTGKYIQALSLLIVSFVFFFILSGFYYLVVRFALKGNGTYSAAMSAFGLPYYIYALQFLVVLIYIFLTQNPVDNLSVATLIGYDKSTYLGILLDKLEFFSIWFYAVVSIGFAKLFELETKKVMITIFSIWIGASLFFHFLAEVFPTMKFFGF